MVDTVAKFYLLEVFFKSLEVCAFAVFFACGQIHVLNQITYGEVIFSILIPYDVTTS